MARYREKSVVIEAKQFLPNILPWPEGVEINSDSRTGYIVRMYMTYFPNHDITPGDWVITASDGTRTRCSDGHFRVTYEAIGT